ncbi:ABC transporter permease [Bradyrhizobium sp.]|jgi:rhamnose transport system permease protein|uniref:ABC transporter permease n=1 Tax=Bradyrhizobium sp. TaxID=376 RepID=UPI003C295D90
MNALRFLRHRDAALALIVLALVAAIGLRAPVFVTSDSMIGVLTDTSFLFMLTLAQMAVILTRGIDLSVAANLALVGMVSALVSRAHPDLPIAAIIVLAITLGGLLGAINGALVALIGIPAIVVTLGTLSIYRGVIFLLAGGAWLTSKDMNPAFLAFPRTDILGVPILVVIAILVSLAFWGLLNHTRLGRGLYAVGGNPVAARYCGIDLGAQQFFVHTLAGAISGLCGYLWVSRYGIAYTDIAQGYELTIIAACVIGGVSIAGGVGSVPGALLGALFLGVVVNALPVINVSPFWQMLISGAVILAAVVINARSGKPDGKLILRQARLLASRGAHS